MSERLTPERIASIRKSAESNAWFVANDDVLALCGECERLTAERDEAIRAVQDLSRTIEFYASRNKPVEEWDEYDHMALPAWKAAAELLAEHPADWMTRDAGAEKLGLF